jgi:hypothetical protein
MSCVSATVKYFYCFLFCFGIRRIAVGSVALLLLLSLSLSFAAIDFRRVGELALKKKKKSRHRWRVVSAC